MRKTSLKLDGSPVRIDEKGVFRVTLSTGEKLHGASFAGLTRKVNSTKGFDTFPVLRYDRYGSERHATEAFACETVVGIQKSRNYWPDSFKLANGKIAGENVVLDTTQNRAVLRAMLKLRNRRATLGEQMEALEKTLVRRTTRDLVTNGIAVKEE